MEGDKFLIVSGPREHLRARWRGMRPKAARP